MKNVLIGITLFMVTVWSVQSQDISKHAIGVRIGDNDGFGAEVSYQLGLGDNNRLEADLGWRDSRNFDALKVTGLYQWVYNLDRGFNWYVGAGGGLGFWSIDDDRFPNVDDDSGSFAFIAGDIGLEYNFEFPLLISLDFRPEIGFGDFYDDLNFDVALGIRYQFN